MKKMSISVSVVAAVLALSGCVSMRPLPKAIAVEAATCDTTLFIPQNNVQVIVSQTNAGNTGILGALVAAGVDAARQSGATKAAAPILEALESYDFRATMNNALSAELSAVSTISISPAVTTQVIATQSQRELSYKACGSDSALFIDLVYTMEGVNLVITAQARLYGKADRLRSMQSTKSATPPLGDGSYIYFNEFSYAFQGVTADNVVKALEEGATNIAKQIAIDLMNVK